MKKSLLLLSMFCFSSFWQIATAQNSVSPIQDDLINEIEKSDREIPTNEWLIGGNGLLNFSLTSFSQWAEGGINTTAIVGNTNIFAYWTNGRNIWENDGRFVLGYTKTEDFDDWRKGDDAINLSSKYGYKLKENLYWSTLAEFGSQFAPGRLYDDADTVGLNPVSRFMSPAVVRFGTGIDYKPKPWLSFYFSPITFKGLIVLDDEIAMSGIHGNRTPEENDGEIQHFRPELGGLLRLKAQGPVMENIIVGTRLELFSNYLENKYGEVKPQNLDVLWITNVGMQINKYISANFEYTLKYDDEISVPKEGDNNTIYQGKGVQSKSFFGLGLSYTFGDKAE